MKFKFILLLIIYLFLNICTSCTIKENNYSYLHVQTINDFKTKLKGTWILTEQYKNNSTAPADYRHILIPISECQKDDNLIFFDDYQKSYSLKDIGRLCSPIIDKGGIYYIVRQADITFLSLIGTNFTLIGTASFSNENKKLTIITSTAQATIEYVYIKKL